jgi:hypothetical protein
MGSLVVLLTSHWILNLSVLKIILGIIYACVC